MDGHPHRYRTVRVRRTERAETTVSETTKRRLVAYAARTGRTEAQVVLAALTELLDREGVQDPCAEAVALVAA